MSWSSPKTFAYKETLSSSDMNTYISDNLTALYNGGWSTTAITLGEAHTTGAQNNVGTGEVDVAGLTKTVIIPAGGRRVKVTARIAAVSAAASNGAWVFRIYEDAVVIGSSNMFFSTSPSGFATPTIYCIAEKVPTAGSHTYKATFQSNSDANIADSTNFLLLELI